MELSKEEKSVFQEKGLLRLKQFIDKTSLINVKSSIIKEIKRLQLQDKSKKKVQGTPLFTNLGQKIKIDSQMDLLFPLKLLQTIKTLSLSQVKPLIPQLLITLPQKEQWTLKNLRWHLDLSVPKENKISGLQAFVLIDDIKPKGGATLAMAGSHKLHYVKEAKGNAHTLLHNNPDFLNLFNNDNNDLSITQIINGIPISLTEMSGQAGDIYLMDLRVLHCPSVNASKNIRMMATNRFV